MLAMTLAILWIVFVSHSAAAQSLKEIRIGSSNISVTNVCAFYARDRKFFEAEGFDAKIIIVKTEAALAALAAGDLDYSTLEHLVHRSHAERHAPARHRRYQQASIAWFGSAQGH